MRFDGGADLLRCDGGAEARDDRTGAVDEELGEVPRDLGVALFVRLLGSQEAVEIAGAVAVDLDLLEYRELDAEARASELEDLFVAAGLLPPELVARECQDVESARAILLMKGMQTCILGCQPSLTGNIDHQADLARVVGERNRLAGDRSDFEIVECRHGPSSFASSVVPGPF